MVQPQMLIQTWYSRGCTVLGDGTRGSYAGVAPEAELYFQAMENDNNGNFQWSSINNMLNTAYNNEQEPIPTHGVLSQVLNGVYTSSSEDVDDRARYYDQYYSGREGLTILFAADNDGPNSDTIGSPATAKNLLTVETHRIVTQALQIASWMARVVDLLMMAGLLPM